MLTESDARTFRNSGFTWNEIRQLADAKTSDGKDQPFIDINSPIWQAVIRSRIAWWQDKVERDWAPWEINKELSAFYERDPKRDVFAFLKAEYRPPKKVDYLEARRKRHEREIASALGGTYERK